VRRQLAEQHPALASGHQFLGATAASVRDPAAGGGGLILVVAIPVMLL
jgi:hypothetical protein